MRLDDLARRAAAEARHTASEMAAGMDATRYRRRRARRGGLALATSAAALTLVAVAVLVRVVPEDDEGIAVPTTTVPVTTTVTVPSVPPPEPMDTDAPQSILGAGWEELNAGPIAGRYRVAAAWTGSELFVWGGHDRWERVEDPSPGDFHQDGFLFDTATGGWRSVAPMPEEICRPLRDPVAVAAGDVVVVRGGAVVVDGCTSAAAYRPASDSWQPLRGEFFRRAGRLVGVAWTGELLVAPRVGLAYDMASGETMELPPFPSGSDDAVLSPQRAHWTGDRVLSIGSGSLREWVPGRDQWTLLSDPPVPDRARDSAWTDQGLLVVDYEMSAAFYLGGGWVRSGDLPLRFYECPAEAISVGGTPVVRTCAGIAIWDQVRGSWVPVPLDGLPSWGSLVSSDNALYTVGPHLRRLRIERNPDGSVVVPPTIPVGDVNLDIPAGFEFVGSDLTESDVVVDQELGVLYSRAINVVFEAEGGRRCTVSSTYSSYPDLTGGIAEVTVSRPGRSGLVVTEFIGPEGGVGFGYLSSTSDVAMVVCDTVPPGVDQEQWRADALAFTAGLWSPWEEPPAHRTVTKEGFRFDVPYGWTLAEESLTPNLSTPQVFSMGTFPMRPGGDRGEQCKHVPQFALDDLGPADAFVSVHGRFGPMARPRPDAFTLQWFDEISVDDDMPDRSGELIARFCLTRADRETMYLRWAMFGEEERSVLVIVALGEDASDETRAQVLRVLDSMEWVGP